jgi:hypothetical protein
MEVNKMKCPYCDNEMEEGALIIKTVPQWLKKDEKIGRFLNCKRHFAYNEILAHRCGKCKKIILEDQ